MIYKKQGTMDIDRSELAKELLKVLLLKDGMGNVDESADKAVRMADALIKRLTNPTA